MTRHEYAFDVKLAAVVRVEADNIEMARSAMEAALDCADFNLTLPSADARVKITEASVQLDDVSGPELFQVDGNDVYEDEYHEPNEEAR